MVSSPESYFHWFGRKGEEESNTASFETAKFMSCKGIWGDMSCAFGMLLFLLSLVKSSPDYIAVNLYHLIFEPIKIAYISTLIVLFIYEGTFGSKFSSFTVTGGTPGSQGLKSGCLAWQ